MTKREEVITMDKEIETAVLSSIQAELKKVQLEKMKTPGGPRLLTSDLNSIATEIIKLLMLHKFSTADLGIVCSLVIYRVTGQWVIIKLE